MNEDYSILPLQNYPETEEYYAGNLPEVEVVPSSYAESLYPPGTYYGRPLEQGLKIWSPEFDILSGVRASRNTYKYLYKPFKKQLEEFQKELNEMKRVQEEQRRARELRKKAEEKMKSPEVQRELRRRATQRGEIYREPFPMPKLPEIDIEALERELLKRRTPLQKVRDFLYKIKNVFENGQHGILRNGFVNDVKEGYNDYVNTNALGGRLIPKNTIQKFKNRKFK